MAADIKRLNQKFGLCRMVAGYGFEWRTNPKKNSADYDIEIGDFHARWNVAQVDWVGSPTSIDEVGCIHTIQGYDLNYCGVIYGPEIGYDSDAEQIVTYKKRYWDLKGKEDQTDKSLRDYIINIYATLMTRGIRGTFVYVCDPNLREYLRQYLE